MAGRRQRPSSRAGAHFLDSRLAAELAVASGVGVGDLVLDLGAGYGSLTAALVARGAQVTAVERDPRCLAVLRRRFTGSRVAIVERDILKLALPTRPYVVVANIPFGITTPLLGRLLDEQRSRLQRAHVVLASAAARQLADSRAGGARTLWWAARYDLRIGRRLPARVFNPAPATDAAILVIERRAQPLIAPRDSRPFLGLLASALRRRSAPFHAALAPVFSHEQLRRLAREIGIEPRDPVGSLTVDQWTVVTVTMTRLLDRSRWPDQQPRWARR